MVRTQDTSTYVVALQFNCVSCHQHPCPAAGSRRVKTVTGTKLNNSTSYHAITTALLLNTLQIILKKQSRSQTIKIHCLLGRKSRPKNFLKTRHNLMPFYIPGDQRKAHKIPILFHNTKLYYLILAESKGNWDRDSIIKLLVLQSKPVEAKCTA